MKLAVILPKIFDHAPFPMTTWKAHGLLRGYTYWNTSNPMETYDDFNNAYNWGTSRYDVSYHNNDGEGNDDGAMSLNHRGDLKSKNGNIL